MRPAIVKRITGMSLLLLLYGLAPPMIHAGDLRVVAFGGGGAVNPVTPPTAKPPNSTAPAAPHLAPSGQHRILSVSVVSPVRRVLVLRDALGRLIGMTVTDPRAAAVEMYGIPASGAFLDVLGTDAIGIPVMPGQVLTVVAP